MKPLICVPMGDAAGVGPEILAAAVCAPEVRGKIKILAVGHAEVLSRAARLMGVDPEINPVGADLAGIHEDALNLVHLDNIDLENFAYGKISANCGKAAYEYIAEAVALASSGLVDALATTPINKESLKSASIPYIGHTEILAGLTSSPHPLTMFQVLNLRVFFLTRHLSLLEACRAVKRERLLEYIRHCAGALELLGIERPKLAVAGLNPHCGEHGLFGNEEDMEIAPAIEDARREGWAVEGPRPADSVFHFALQGRWDAVISLYHDQGHIAAKMVDFERTISITLGLPFLRTSVDHGTAFDIAGTGRAGSVSMVEALRLAALYAPAFRKKSQAAFSA
jgi:4-hydroxythreonine-4-phosphate dehydrogenase